MKICRLCLNVRVKLFKLGNTEHKDFINSILKLRGFNDEHREYDAASAAVPRSRYEQPRFQTAPVTNIDYSPSYGSPNQFFMPPRYLPIHNQIPAPGTYFGHQCYSPYESSNQNSHNLYNHNRIARPYSQVSPPHNYNYMPRAPTEDLPFDLPIDLSFMPSSQPQNLSVLAFTQSQALPVVPSPGLQYETLNVPRTTSCTVTCSMTHTVTQEHNTFPHNFNNPQTLFAYSPHLYEQAVLEQAPSHLFSGNTPKLEQYSSSNSSLVNQHPPSSENPPYEQSNYDLWSSRIEQAVTQTTDDTYNFDTSWIESLVSEPEPKITLDETSTIEPLPSGFTRLTEPVPLTSASESSKTSKTWSEVVQAGKMPRATRTAPNSTTTAITSSAPASTCVSSNSGEVSSSTAVMPISTSSTDPFTAPPLTTPSNTEPEITEEVGTEPEEIPEVSALSGVPVRPKSVRPATTKP